MLRIVTALALAAGLLLAAGLASAFAGSDGRHWALGAIGLGLAAAVHLASAGSLQWSRRRIAAKAGRPAWLEVQAARNCGKASACQAAGLALVALAGWSGWALSGPWHRVLAAMALGFQPGAFLVEGLMVAAQGRLAGEAEV